MSYGGMYSGRRPTRNTHGIKRTKGVKTVMQNSMVAHVWSQQTQEAGRSPNGNFYFEGATIYSYGSHFPIARFTTDAHGNHVVLFTTEGYSNTTADHKSDVRRALRGLPGVRVWETEFVDYRVDHSLQVANMVKAFEATAAKACKAHVAKWKPEYNRVVELQDEADAIRDYARAFGVPEPELDLGSKVAAIAASFAAYNDPKALAKRMKASAKTRLPHYRTMTLHHAYLEGATSQHPTREQWDKLPRELKGLQWVRPDYLRAAWRTPTRDVSPADWCAGKGDMNSCSQQEPTLIRKVGARLETSRGAEVPFAQAVAVFLKAQQCRQSSTAWRTNVKQMRVGVFAVSSVDTSGNIVAGCHSIAWAEMLRLALLEIPNRVQPSYPVPAVI